MSVNGHLESAEIELDKQAVPFSPIEFYLELGYLGIRKMK
jgi:hypothetical protein